MAKPKKKGQPLYPRYEARDTEYGTPQERLASGVAQVGGVDALLSLMDYMQSGSPAPMFQMEDVDTRRAGTGRVYRDEDSKAMFVQSAGEDGGYSSRGRRLTSADVGDITGYSGEVSPSDRRVLNSLLQNEDVLRYFMDIYGEGSEDYERVKTYSQRGSNAGSSYGTNRSVGRIDPSCKGGQCWQN